MDTRILGGQEGYHLLFQKLYHVGGIPQVLSRGLFSNPFD